MKKLTYEISKKFDHVVWAELDFKGISEGRYLELSIQDQKS